MRTKKKKLSDAEWEMLVQRLAVELLRIVAHIEGAEREYSAAAKDAVEALLKPLGPAGAEVLLTDMLIEIWRTKDRIEEKVR